MLPHSVITVSLATAYFTRMSAHAAKNDHVALAGDAEESMRRVVLFMTWAMVALVSVAMPFSTLFATTFTGVTQLGWVIVATAIGLPAFSVLFLIQRVFYSLGDGRTPFFITLYQAVVFSALVLMCSWLPREILAVGVASTLSAVGITQTVLALILLRRRMPAFSVRPIIKTSLRGMVAGAVSLIAGVGTASWLGAFASDGFAVANTAAGILSTAIIGAIVSIVFIVVLRLLRTRELSDLLPANLRWGGISDK
jgi:putative peptidoglycan lipid II flippase